MNDLQRLLLIAMTLFSIAGFCRGLWESKQKKNPFGITYAFRILGAFVWADSVIFGIFWASVAIICLLRADWLLYLLTLSLFWLVRSVGETMYWFNQQFSPINRNPVKNFTYLKKVFLNDSVWFVYQIFWQCMTVVSILLTLYFGKLWLATIT